MNVSKNLSTETVSTIGDQRRSNYALAAMTEDAFVGTLDNPLADFAAHPDLIEQASRLPRLDQPPPDSQRKGLLDMTTPNQIPSIEAADLTTMPDAILLDVREPNEWVAGHAPQAVHIPLGDLDRRAGELPAGRPVVCICRSGARSLRAAALLVENGFDVHNLKGGMLAWSVAELAVVTPEGTTGDVI